MPKTKKYSLDYWVKKVMGGWTPERDILAAVQTYVKGGEHPEIEFSGSSLAFATALYLSRFKRGTPWSGFFPTPEKVADWAADLLPINRGAVVLDPGCGFGSLSAAVEKRGAVPLMVEVSSAVTPIAQAIWGEDRVAYRDFLDGYRPTAFDAVATNPPFGNVFGHSDAAGDFMERIADLSRGGTYVSAILPRGYLEVDRPKRRVEIAQRFTIIERRDLSEDTFAPLTKIATTLYLLTVKRDGKMVGEVLPRATKSIAVSGQRVTTTEAAADESAAIDYADEVEASDELDDAESAEVLPPATWHDPRELHLTVDGEAVRVEYQGRESTFAQMGGLDFHLHGPSISPTGFRAHLTHYREVASHGTPEAAARHIVAELQAAHRTFLEKNRRTWPLDLPAQIEVDVDGLTQSARPISWSESNKRWEVWLIDQDQGLTVKPEQILTPARPPKRVKSKGDAWTRAGWTPPQPVSVPTGWHAASKFQFHLDGQLIKVEYHGSASLGFSTGQLQFGFFSRLLSPTTGFYNIMAEYADVAHCGNPEMAAIELAQHALNTQTGQNNFKSETGEPAKQPPSDAAIEVVAVTNPPTGVQWKQPKFYAAVHGDQMIVVMARGVDDVQAEVQRGTVLLNSVGFDSHTEAADWLKRNGREADLPAELAGRISAVAQRELKPVRGDHSGVYDAWRDDVLMLMRPKQQPGTRWVACAAKPDGEWTAISSNATTHVQGATLFEALDALRAWLCAVNLAVEVRLRPINPGWTAATVAELIEVVSDHPIVLIADDDLGVPTIHGLPNAEHKGYGLFTTTCAEYAGSYDAGGSMQRLSTNLGWTELRLDRGVFPYDKAQVLTKLRRWQVELTPVIKQTVVCSNCQEVLEVAGAGLGPIIKAYWKIESPYVFCQKCVERGIHPPTYTAGTDFAVTDLLPMPADLPTEHARAEWQRTLVAFESARGKESWQMTREEFFATHRPFSDGAGHHPLLQLIVNHEYDVVSTLTDNEKVSAGILTAAVDYLDRLRGVLVQVALTEGKPVSEEIQREFPDEAESARQQRDKAAAKATVVAPVAVIDADDLDDEDAAAEDDLDDECDLDECDGVLDDGGCACSLEEADAEPVTASGATASADWSQPVDFAIEVDGEMVEVHSDGFNSIGYSHGSLHFEFFGPSISSSGYRSYFTYLKAVSQYGNPQSAARIIAAELAKELAAEIKKAKKKWPRKPTGDMAVRVAGEVKRAHLISWNDFNAWWSAWLRRDNEPATIKDDDVLDDWTSHFAAHLNPGEHVVYRSVSAILHGNVVRVVPGTAHSVEVQLPDGTHQIVSSADLIGLWDELSPAERGEKFEVPTFGLGNINPFDMLRADFDEWVLAADPLHGVEWSEAYRYFADGFALSVAGWAYFTSNPHFAEKRRAIDPHLVGNPFDAPRDQFIRWVQAHVDGTNAQAAYLQGYAAVTGGSEHILLTEARAYLATQPLYGKAWAVRQTATIKAAAPQPEPVAAPVSVETAEPTVEVTTVFDTVREMKAWVQSNRTRIRFVVPYPAGRPQVKLGVTVDFFKAIVNRGALVEFKDMPGQPQTGEFEKWQRNGAMLVQRYTAQREVSDSFSVSLDRVTTVHLDFTVQAKPVAQPAAAPVPVEKASKTATEPKVKRPSGLPADVPEVIEVDVGGRKPAWVLATIIKVMGPQLTCKRQDDHTTLKTPLYGRDITWRVPSVGSVA